MATILISNVGNHTVKVIDKFDAELGKTIYRVVETGFENTNEKIAIRNARKYLHKIAGIKDKLKIPTIKEENPVSWEYEKFERTLKIDDSVLLSIAEEIKLFKAEINEKKVRGKIDSRNKRNRSKRNISGIRFNPDWRQIY